MKTQLFHREVYMPADIREQFHGRTFRLAVSGHARVAARSDRYGVLSIPETVTVEGGAIVEAEASESAIEKIVVRTSYDATRDAVYVLIPDGPVATLKTVWFNLKSDRHKTLDKKNYARA